MDSHRWNRIQELFEAALERDPGGRDAFVRSQAGDDEELYQEVRSLIEADSASHSLLEGHAVDAVGLPEHLAMEGKRIGNYRIIRQIGTGGMGAVYLAERADGQFEHRVALKLIKLGMDSAAILRRFHSERQILARLQHPNIARLLDGGITTDGSPYFSMEYVDGEPIDSYCDRHKLTIDERLAIFQTVCSAVQYAHHNLVVHRDLKPGNIFITADGRVKLLDFGIAKLTTDSDGSDTATTLTHMGQRVMTPEYASPEQVRGEPVTTASDVYSLGIILYELLTGCRPYELKGRSTSEAEYIITTTDPRKPSLVLRKQESAAPSQRSLENISSARSTHTERLRKKLSGDLDTICLTALRKEADRRYGSVEQLQEDIRRHVQGLPISARPATLRYRTTKFVRRHRFGLAITATVMLVITSVTAYYTHQVAIERDRARLEARKAEQVSEFLTGLFSVADPSESRGRTITARELLERGAGKIERELEGQPEIQATMMDVTGKVYQSLGLYENADSLLRKAYALRTALYGENHPDVATALNALGSLWFAMGRFAAAESSLQRALKIRMDVFGPENAQTAESMNDLAMILRERGDLPSAEDLLKRSLATYLQVSGEGSREVAEVLNNLALCYQDRGEYDGADSLMRRVLKVKQGLYGDIHPAVSNSISNLALLLRDKGEYSESEALYRKALEIDSALYGSMHPSISSDLYSLGALLQDIGKLDTAETMFRQVLSLDRVLLGDNHPYIALDFNNIGSVLSERGKLDEAEAMYRKALGLNVKNFGDTHPETATSLSNLGVVLKKKRKYDEAERLIQKGLAIRRALYGENHPHVATSLSILASVLLEKGDYAGALAQYRQVLSLRQKLLGQHHTHTGNTYLDIGTALMKMDSTRAAETMMREGITILRGSLPSGHWGIDRAESILGECLARLHKYDEAEQLLVQSYDGLVTTLGPGHQMTEDARRRLARFSTLSGRPESALHLP
jgi:serine/threonine protein kinase/tetratricopeptide (TPR) repeat protein